MSGLGGFLNPDNAFFTFMGKAFDILVLNLLFLVCYIPFFGMIYLFGTTENIIFTILAILSLVVVVPSFTALYYSIVKAVRRQRSYAIKEFYRSFVSNFKQGAFASAVVVAFVWFLYIDYQYAWTKMNDGSSSGLIVFAVFLAITYFLLGTFIYLFPVLSRFSMTLFNAFKFSFGIAMRHVWCTVLSILLWLFIALAIYLTNGFVVMFGISCGVLVESFMMEKVLKIYVVKMMENNEKASDEASSEEGEEEKKDEWYLE